MRWGSSLFKQTLIESRQTKSNYLLSNNENNGKKKRFKQSKLSALHVNSKTFFKVIAMFTQS